MKIFAIADLHLGFSVQKPMAIFGAHWEKHEEKIKAYWESQISEEDMVLIPGDISWAMRLNEARADLNWLEALPGKKICIRGNHDYWWDRPTKLNNAYHKITFLQSTAYLIGDLAICGSRGWECTPKEEAAKETERIRMVEREVGRLKLSLEAAKKAEAREIWVMLHYPPTAGDTVNSPFIELIKQYPVTKVIYGHLHDEASWQIGMQGEYDGINYELVSADYLAFKPLLIKEIEMNQ